MCSWYGVSCSEYEYNDNLLSSASLSTAFVVTRLEFGTFLRVSVLIIALGMFTLTPNTNYDNLLLRFLIQMTIISLGRFLQR